MYEITHIENCFQKLVHQLETVSQKLLKNFSLVLIILDWVMCPFLNQSSGKENEITVRPIRNTPEVDSRIHSPETSGLHGVSVGGMGWGERVVV